MTYDTPILMLAWLYSRDGLITVAVALYFMAVGTDIMLTIEEYKTSQKTVQPIEKGVVVSEGDRGTGGEEEGRVTRGGKGRGRPSTKEIAAIGIDNEVLSSISPKRKQKQKPSTLR